MHGRGRIILGRPVLAAEEAIAEDKAEDEDEVRTPIGDPAPPLPLPGALCDAAALPEDEVEASDDEDEDEEYRPGRRDLKAEAEEDRAGRRDLSESAERLLTHPQELPATIASTSEDAPAALQEGSAQAINREV